MVKGDATRLRKVLANPFSNAFQNSVEGGVKVDVRPIKTKDDISTISITVQDIGFGHAPPFASFRSPCHLRSLTESQTIESLTCFIASTGWMLKPVDFRRLDVILQSFKIAGIRREGLYRPGNWEQGRWFLS
jgi:hypothetical protein